MVMFEHKKYSLPVAELLYLYQSYNEMQHCHGNAFKAKIEHNKDGSKECAAFIHRLGWKSNDLFCKGLTR